MDTSQLHCCPKPKPQNALAGYTNYSPTFQLYWQNNSPLIQRIMDQHDVSKHRETIFRGGRPRNDPPSGFYENTGVVDDDQRKWQFTPMAEIILSPAPTNPRLTHVPTPVGEEIRLEPLAESFCDFMNTSARYALFDARSKVNLAHSQFQTSGCP